MKVRTQGLVVKMVVMVGVVDKGPSPALPQGRESIPAMFEEVWWNALPLGRVGEGPLCLGNSVGVAIL